MDNQTKAKLILTKPNAGWSSFKYNDEMRISYIDDMPFFVLEEMISSIKERRAFVVTFDAEGYDYSIISYDKRDVEVIFRKNEYPTIIRLNDDFKTFIDKFIFSIKQYIRDWAIFPACFDDSYNEKESIEKLEDLIYELEKLLESNHL